MSLSWQCQEQQCHTHQPKLHLMENPPGDWPPFPGTPVGANLPGKPAVLGQVFAQTAVSQGIGLGCATAKCLTAALGDHPGAPIWRVAPWGASCRATPGSPLWVAVPELAAGCACWLWPGSCCLKPIIICVILTAEGTDLQSFFLVRHNHQPDLSCLAGMHTQ